MSNTYSPNPDTVKINWQKFDANGKILGRLATEIASVLTGKAKPEYTPHLDLGDHVVVINAEKIKVTGKKLTDKIYYNYSGYPGGMKERTLQEQMDKNPAEAVKIAVWGMLPKNKLRKQRIKKLHVYAGEEHPHVSNIK
jgi:large subunit ribosomal protein L13